MRMVRGMRELFLLGTGSAARGRVSRDRGGSAADRRWALVAGSVSVLAGIHG
ncbi:hypothetical protein GCM10010298_33990 [Streptomyces microflavus]|nr:hypothetical protein GCM10010298_33990 [Streptomyces microflavus]